MESINSDSHRSKDLCHWQKNTHQFDGTESRNGPTHLVNNFSTMVQRQFNGEKTHSVFNK